MTAPIPPQGNPPGVPGVGGSAGGVPGVGGSNRRKQQQKSRRRGPKAKTVDVWRAGSRLTSPPDPITPAGEPTALLRSLGDPPLQGQGAVAEHYLAAVVERAASVATALAAAAGLLSADGGADA